MKRVSLVVISLLMFFSTLVLANQVRVPLAEAAMSGCHSNYLSSGAGGYSYCTSGSGGSVRVKIWCYSSVTGTAIYYGPKVYGINQTSTKLCPPDRPAITGATHILGT
jgi:hypothetical protein